MNKKKIVCVAYTTPNDIKKKKLKLKTVFCVHSCGRHPGGKQRDGHHAVVVWPFVFHGIPRRVEIA
jgi:hypothetical protein